MRGDVCDQRAGGYIFRNKNQDTQTDKSENILSSHKTDDLKFRVVENEAYGDHI